MEEKLNRYLHGIHLEELKIYELKEVLKKYNVTELPDQPSICKNEFDKESEEKYRILKNIYHWALNVVLINGHCFSLRWDSPECVNSTIYYNDMIMLLYLYEINKESPLCIGNMAISTVNERDFYKVEQSGYGNILGLRRENDKRVIYRLVSPEKNKEKNKEGIQTVERRIDEKKTKFLMHVKISCPHYYYQ